MTKCEWQGHADAMNEAGWCPVCDEGEIDAEFARRNEIETD